ncbi:MAG: N-6 DNA methylase [Actinobacteria bacterium]|uniref:Unannotated protein n=1 Tax=freshwater metagenome TaxID=449393 RepID=A0A6J7KJW7_9ZZZZ|nr:N-6 DNA methylase [Actinomycetota bacterium]
MWQAIHMTIGSLATAARNHGAAPITIDEFAVIVDTTPAALRGRRDRDENFPAPINTNATPLTYLLRDLFEWWRRSTRNTTPRTVNRRALAEWTFNAAFEQCSARHGAEATHRLVAGASLILLERRHLITRTPADERLGLLRAHVATVRSSIRRNAIDRASFRADPIPATDGPFLASLLNWSGETGRSSGRDDTDVDDVGTPLIPDDSAEAAELIERLDALRHDYMMATSEPPKPGLSRFHAFIEAIEPFIQGIARDTATRSSRTEAGLTRLMVAMADPQPGDVVVDLACGQGSTFIEADRVVRDTRPGSQVIGCIGRESDASTWTVAKVRLGLRGIPHDLGAPGDDGLKCDFTQGPNQLFITEPGVRPSKLKLWMQRHRDLLLPGGTALLAVPANIVFSTKRDSSRSWLALQSSVDAAVFTPTDSAVLVLRPDAGEWKSLVQIHRMSAVMAERRYWEQHPELLDGEQRPPLPLAVVDPAIEPFMPAQIERATTVVGRFAVVDRNGRKPVEGDEDFVQWRPIRSLTLEALGRPRFGDCTAIKDAVPEPEPEPTAPAPRSNVSEIASPEEPRRGSALGGSQRRSRSFAALRDAERVDNLPEEAIARRAQELENDALKAVQLLRWLIDPATFNERSTRPPTQFLSPKVNGALEELGTEEMRRALRRLELRLLGEETRGRKSPEGTKPE